MLYQRTEQGISRFQGDLPEAAAGAIERADEEAIMAAMGDERHREEYLYRLQVEGKELVGISVAGAFEMARLLGSVEVLPEVKTDRDEAGYHIVVRVRDNLRQVTLLGAARQPLRKQVPVLDREGRETGEKIDKPDANAWVVALNKAQRNGLLRLVSSETRQRIIEEFLARGRRGESNQRQAQPVPDGQAARASARQVSHQAAAVSPADPLPASITPSDFAAGCKQKGYRTSAEVCSALGFADKRELARCGLARALERLPDLQVTSSDESDLDEVDLGF
ncbi:MAG: hypothetical protein Q7R39_00935 [Dehalococcoidia bacterium]|nr:hypothetical protein [Dehalococcoidia bacterium]